jgi:hypothetical protein
MSKLPEHRSIESSEPRTVDSNPSHEEIALRAYLVYLERGGIDGHDLEHWLEAERELQAEVASPALKSRASASTGPE